MQATKITTTFRFLLSAAVVVISYLSFAQIESEAIESVNDKIWHALGFLALALLVDLSWPYVSFSVRKFLPLLGYGLAIEIVQYFLPYRTFSLLDLAADGAGILGYLAVSPLVRMSGLKGPTASRETSRKN